MVSIKYAVHRARNIQLCGRHRFSRIFNIIYFHSNTMKPVICILTGFIIGYGLDSCIIYQTIQSYSFQLIIFSVNHFRRITGAINQITIFIEHHRSNIYNNSNADTNG